jgi:hypothetical protein
MGLNQSHCRLNPNNGSTKLNHSLHGMSTPHHESLCSVLRASHSGKSRRKQPLDRPGFFPKQNGYALSIRILLYMALNRWICFWRNTHMICWYLSLSTVLRCIEALHCHKYIIHSQFSIITNHPISCHSISSIIISAWYPQYIRMLSSECVYIYRV